MAVPQALMTWPGVQAIDRGSFTLSHGIAPSVAQLTITPQPSRTIAEIGTLTLSFGRDRWQFPQCRVTFADVQDGTSMTLRIQDRRWKWRDGYIVGHYNLRKKDGTLDTSTEKTPQQLAQLLLRAMGEQRFSVAALPNVDRPEMRWDFVNPAVELQKLCENRSCRVVLGTDNRVRIVRTGQGAQLPQGGKIADSYGLNAPGVPDALLCLGGAVRFQSALKLEAVAKEKDGDVSKLSSVSYLLEEDDAGGLGKFGPGFPGISNKDDRAAAEESVFKWYRVVSQIDGTQNVPGFQLPQGAPALKVENILPLFNRQVDTYTDGDGVKRPAEPIVYGTYWKGGYSLENATDAQYKGAFTIEGDTGIVKFSEQVKRITGDSSDFSFLPAELYLVTSYNVTINGQVIRFGREQNLGPKNGTGPRVLRRPEIDRQIVARYEDYSVRKVTSVADNLNAVNREADHYLTAAQLEYQIGETQALEYPGLRRIDPDGAIQQVAWSFGAGGSRTKASRNNEADIDVPDYATRQRIAKRLAAEANG